MKLRALIILLLLGFLAFALYTVTSTGYFRTVENYFDGKILKKIKLYGAEDITLSYKDSFAIISSTDRKFLNTTNELKNGLYFIDLKDTSYTPVLLTADFKKEFNPHGISLFQKDSSYFIYAVNHFEKDQHGIEVFQLKNNKAEYLKTLSSEKMVSPNDVVVLDENNIYFTNDHYFGGEFGKLIEDYLGIAKSNVMHFDGTNYTKVADGIAYANGINADKKRNLVYVASPRHFAIKVYQRNENNSLIFIENIDCKTGVDNVEIDNNATLWSGAHPNLLRFASYARGRKETSPSEIIKVNYESKNNYTVEPIYVENGATMSASSVAIPFGDIILTGNVMDNNFLILQPNKQ